MNSAKKLLQLYIFRILSLLAWTVKEKAVLKFESEPPATNIGILLYLHFVDHSMHLVLCSQLELFLKKKVVQGPIVT